jgi:arginyl-tRNA synthetase
MVAARAQRAIDAMMAMIREDLAALNITHLVFASERALTGVDGGQDRVRETIEWLRAKGLVYQGRLPPPKGAPSDDWEDREQTLFRSTDFGDDVDRPLIKSDGGYTYFASDIAYHKTKIDRNFRTLVDVWGADHGGYVKRVQAAVAALSDRKAKLEVRLCQLVRLMRAGEPVKMSKRSGDFVTLRDPYEVGRCCPVHDADAQERRHARFRPGEGDRAKPGQSRFLCPICARSRLQRSAAGESCLR